jgi:3-methyladenine DNA glycosylase/8-oxoguanine DNA glycosylase
LSVERRQHPETAIEALPEALCEAESARRHLLQVDDRLASLVGAAGLVNPYVWPDVPLHEGDLFGGLVFHIVSQQISVGAAISLFEKLGRHLEGHITPEALVASTLEELRIVASQQPRLVRSKSWDGRSPRGPSRWMPSETWTTIASKPSS